MATSDQVDPNPDTTQFSIFDYARSSLLLPYMLWTSLRVAAKRATKSGGNETSFLADFALTLSRRWLDCSSRGEETSILISPWVYLLCSHGDSFVYNIENDFLNRDTLVEWAKWLIGQDPTGEASSLVDFGQPRQGDQSWSKMMPKKVWISAGSHEIFLGDITRLVESLKADGVLVDFDVAKGRCHTWQQVEDNLQSQKYFKTTDSVLPGYMMGGAANIASGILAMVKKN